MTNVDYVTKGSRPVVHTWRRTDDGKRVHETDESFRPYFFISENETTDPERFSEVIRVEEGDFQNIHGEPLKKVYVETPKQVGGYDGIRNEFDETWESDVYFRTRYWLDKLVPEDSSNRARVLSYDIEVDHSLDAANAPRAITAITAHDNFKDKYATFLLQPDGKKVGGFRKESHNLYVYDDEREMLMEFIDFINTVDPDIVTGWNLDSYDAPYLINRCRQKRIDYSELSPINRVEVSNDRKRVHTVRGREFIDMIPAFQKIYFSDLESWKLNNVGANLLGKEKVKFDTNLSQLWRDDPEKFIEYNKRDVEIMVDLDEKFRVWDLFMMIQSVVGINLGDIIHNTRITQAYFMRHTDMKMPRSTFRGKEDYTGGQVMEPTPGVSENVAVGDLKSQYPSSMISYNMSPEKKVESPEATDAKVVTPGNGVFFEYDELGFVPEILIELLEWRDEVKAERDEFDVDSDDYQRLNLLQRALKVIANSIYGALGHEKFVLYDRAIARSTTYVGRKTVEWSAERAQELGYPVTYGDTDSIMFPVGEGLDVETCVDKGQKLMNYINESYDDYADNHGVDLRELGLDRRHMFEIELEKIYSRFFQQKAKKKYAAKVSWKEGEYVDGWDWANYGKRSSMAQVSRDLQRKFLKMILNGASEKELQEYITGICKKIKNDEYDLDYIGIPSKMKKHPDEYKTDRPILRAVDYANKYLDEEFGKGDKPKYLYVKKTPSGLPDTDVVCFSQVTLPKGFVVDHDKMIRKIVKNKIKRIISVLGIEWEEMYHTSSSLLDI